MLPNNVRDQDDDQEIVVSVAVLTSRFNALDRGMDGLNSVVRELDRAMTAMTSRFDRETDRLRGVEIEHQAKLTAMDLKITALQTDVNAKVTAVQNDVNTKFTGLSGQVGGKVSTVWVERSAVFVKDLVPWLVAAAAIAGKVHLSP